MSKPILMFLTATSLLATGAGAAPFSMDEDFSVRDERGLTPAIEIEKRSSLSHLHGEVTDEGGFGYRVLVPGNRHYLAMPPVGDFTLKVDYDLHLYYNEFGLGYDVFFAGGHVLRVYFDHDGTLGFFLDGRKFADGAKTLEKGVQEYPSTLTMEIRIPVASFCTFKPGENWKMTVVRDLTMKKPILPKGYFQALGGVPHNDTSNYWPVEIK